jgi:hypothetical protein
MERCGRGEMNEPNLMGGKYTGRKGGVNRKSLITIDLIGEL